MLIIMILKFFYRTAICTLHEYVKKNKRYGDINDELEKQIKNLLGQPNTSSEEQENNVRKILNMDDAEILILFIGIGNYPEICQTTKSERKAIEITEI